MTQKTYGVEGLMDWVCQLKAGGVTLVVHFKGGTMTQYGVTPAEYKTTNKYYQWLIEHSEAFKSGRIKLLRTLETADPAPAKAGGEAKAKTAQAEKATKSEAKAPEVIKVATMADAIDIMKQRYGYTTLQVRTKDAMRVAAAAHNIKFDGIAL